MNATTDLGVTPLWAASQNGSAAMVRKLLEAGANPNAALLAAARPANIGSGDTPLEALLKALEGGDDKARLQATMALADLGPKAEPAIGRLVAALQSKNEDLRLQAAIVLGKIG